jgi:hypothetical protein
LAGRHGCLFVEITPGSVDYCDVVFLVAYIHTSVRFGREGTFDGVGFGELRAVGKDFGGDGIPCHSFRKTHVDMRRGQIIDMELELACMLQ